MASWYSCSCWVGGSIWPGGSRKVEIKRGENFRWFQVNWAFESHGVHFFNILQIVCMFGKKLEHVKWIPMDAYPA